MLPETYKREYYTTARVIHKEGEADWLWVNMSQGHQFSTPEESNELAKLANHNGNETGIDVKNYPYFTVRVEQRTRISKVGEIYYGEPAGTSDDA